MNKRKAGIYISMSSKLNPGQKSIKLGEEPHSELLKGTSHNEETTGKKI